jgi:hypothetical protein
MSSSINAGVCSGLCCSDEIRSAVIRGHESPKDACRSDETRRVEKQSNENQRVENQ